MERKRRARKKSVLTIRRRDARQAANSVRVAEVQMFLETVLGRPLPEFSGVDGLMGVLDTGILLCEVIQKGYPEMNIKCKMSAKSNAFYARDNLAVFGNACVELGMSFLTIFEPEDVISRRNPKLVLNTIIRLSQYMQKKEQKTAGSGPGRKKGRRLSTFAVKGNKIAAMGIGKVPPAEVKAESNDAPAAASEPQEPVNEKPPQTESVSPKIEVNSTSTPGTAESGSQPTQEGGADASTKEIEDSCLEAETPLEHSETAGQPSEQTEDAPTPATETVAPANPSDMEVVAETTTGSSSADAVTHGTEPARKTSAEEQEELKNGLIRLLEKDTQEDETSVKVDSEGRADAEDAAVDDSSAATNGDGEQGSEETGVDGGDEEDGAPEFDEDDPRYGIQTEVDVAAAIVRSRYLPYIPDDHDKIDRALAKVLNANLIDLRCCKANSRRKGEYMVGVCAREMVFFRLVREVLFVMIDDSWEDVEDYLEEKWKVERVLEKRRKENKKKGRRKKR